MHPIRHAELAVVFKITVPVPIAGFEFGGGLGALIGGGGMKQPA